MTEELAIYYHNNLFTWDISLLIKKNSYFGSDYYDSVSLLKAHSLPCGAKFQFVKVINQIRTYADPNVKKFQEKIWSSHFCIVQSVWTYACEWVFIYKVSTDCISLSCYGRNEALFTMYCISGHRNYFLPVSNPCVSIMKRKPLCSNE